MVTFGYNLKLQFSSETNVRINNRTLTFPVSAEGNSDSNLLLSPNLWSREKKAGIHKHTPLLNISLNKQTFVR